MHVLRNRNGQGARKVRRISWIVAAVAAIAVSVSGCSHEGVTEPEAKQEIIVVCSNDMSGTLDEIMRKFTNLSKKTKVKLIEFSNESADVYWKTTSMIADGETKIDAMITEDVWVKGFIENDYLLDLGLREELSLDDFPNGIDKFIGDEKNIYYYPLILDMGLMYYRSDKVAAPKNTFDIDKKGVPYAVQGADGEEMLCCALEYIRAADSVSEGLKSYKAALLNAVGGDDGEFLSEFTSGNAFYMRAWASDCGKITGRLSAAGAELGEELLKNEADLSYSTSRTYGYAVNKATDNAENCKELLEYLKTDEVRLDILKGMKTLPIRRSDYENPIVLDFGRCNAAAAEIFDRHNFRPARADYAGVSRDTRSALKKYLQNEGTLEEAAAAIERLLY